MTQHIRPAPIRKTVTVKAPPEAAFQVFTAGMGRWWRPDHHIGKSPLKDVVLEPRVGGRWFEVGEEAERLLVDDHERARDREGESEELCALLVGARQDDSMNTGMNEISIIITEKKISAIPDWSKALRPDFMAKARAGA